jgi:membrane fusion protein, multidrug efflux system
MTSANSRLSRLGLTLLGALALAACGSGGESNAPGDRHAGGPAGGRPELPPTPVAVTAAESGEIANTYSATATLEAEADAQILARVAGVVESIIAEEGDVVRDGSPLLQIENDEYRYLVDQAQAKTQNLVSRYDRMKGMVDRKLVSDEEFETAASDLADAEATEGLARLQLGYSTVRSPFDGRVIERLVDPGQTVSVGTPLFRVADFDPLLARVHVPAKEFLQLEVDQPVRLILDSNRAELAARVQRVSPIIDPNSGTIKITIEIDAYPAGTRPGDFAQVRIVTERRSGRTLVPRIAVITDKGDQVVYVAQGDRAERRVVETGFSTDEVIEIMDGVLPGEAVVVKGQRSLRNGAPLRVLEGAAPAAVAQVDSTERPVQAKRPAAGKRGRRQG